MLTLALLILALGTPAFASDGVLEINQACATSAGGCFAGDATGFPVTINQPGSYRLTGNLSVPSNVTGIDIVGNNVALDLGGFSIMGPNVCTGLPLTGCTFTDGGARGISALQSEQYGVTVRNGSVTGMPGGGVLLGLGAANSTPYFMSVEDLVVVGNGSVGIEVGGLSRVVRCRVSRNWQQGILTGPQSLVEDNDVYANRVYGVQMIGGQAIKNRIRFNGLNGIFASTSAPILVRENTFSFHSGGAWPGGAGDPRILSLNDNLCDNLPC